MPGMGGGGGDGGMLDVNQMMQTARQMGMGGPQQRQKVWLEQGTVAMARANTQRRH